ncbi:MAG: sodium:proton antiporter [Caldilineaceae bacterium]|nr:sodium:proton antiporter [Caldilineaceae bacterium]
MEHSELLLVGGVLAAGSLCQWFAWRVKIPAILPLLAIGFLAGPITGILHPQAVLGNLFFPLISLSVAVILFEGSLTLNWREVRTVATTVRNLLSIGALVTWFGGALGARYVLGLPWDLSLLFGALIIVTGPTVIAPLLRNVRPTANISSILRWEGIVIDPIGASIAVLVFDIIAAGGGTWQHTVWSFLQIAVVGTVLGLASGYATDQLIRRYLVPDYLRDISVLTFVLGIFALSDWLAAESGLLAVTVMGVYLANTDLPQLREIWYFKERLSVLLISTLFILLAANVQIGDLALLDWRAFLLLAIIMFVLRPVGVLLSALGSSLSVKERAFLSWVAPRGIVAAAISSLFAFRLVDLGYADARILGPLVFLVIVGTVLLQGSTAKAIARRLGVSEAEPQGFLLMGAAPFARVLAKALQEEGFVVRLVDSNYQQVMQARVNGLQVRQGNILSDYIDENLELGGIGYFLALTSNDEANALACHHFAETFGSSNVYQLQPSASAKGTTSAMQATEGRILFGPDFTYRVLEEYVENGAAVRRTKLTDKFSLANFRQQSLPARVPLLAIQNRQANLVSRDQPLQPTNGATILSLALPTKSDKQ